MRRKSDLALRHFIVCASIPFSVKKEMTVKLYSVPLSLWLFPSYHESN